MHIEIKIIYLIKIYFFLNLKTSKSFSISLPSLSLYILTLIFIHFITEKLFLMNKKINQNPLFYNNLMK